MITIILEQADYTVFWRGRIKPRWLFREAADNSTVICLRFSYAVGRQYFPRVCTDPEIYRCRAQRSEEAQNSATGGNFMKYGRATRERNSNSCYVNFIAVKQFDISSHIFLNSILLYFLQHFIVIWILEHFASLIA